MDLRRTDALYRYRRDEKPIDGWYPFQTRRRLSFLFLSTIAVEYEKHHDVRKKDGLFEGYFVCATKTIVAPPADVFKAWSTGAELSKWFGGGAKADVKDGGAFENKDGDKGTFLRVRQNKDIRMTFENSGVAYAGGRAVSGQRKR